MHDNINNLYRLFLNAIEGKNFDAIQFNSIESLILWALIFPSSSRINELIEQVAGADSDPSMYNINLDGLSNSGLIYYNQDADFIRITDSGTATITFQDCGNKSFSKAVYSSLSELNKKILTSLDQKRYFPKNNLVRFFGKMPLRIANSFEYGYGNLKKTNYLLEFDDFNKSAPYQRGITISDRGFESIREEFYANWKFSEKIKELITKLDIDYRQFYKGLIHHLYDTAAQIHGILSNKRTINIPKIQDIIGHPRNGRVTEAIRRYFMDKQLELSMDSRLKLTDYLFSLCFIYILQSDSSSDIVSSYPINQTTDVNIILDTNVLISLASEYDQFHKSTISILQNTKEQSSIPFSVNLFVTNYTLHELLRVVEAHIQLLDSFGGSIRQLISKSESVFSSNGLLMLLAKKIIDGAFPKEYFLEYIRSHLRDQFFRYNISLLERKTKEDKPLIQHDFKKEINLLADYENECLMENTLRDLIHPIYEPQLHSFAYSGDLLDKKVRDCLKHEDIGENLYKLLDNRRRSASGRLEHKAYLLLAANKLHNMRNDKSEPNNQHLTFIWTYHKRLRDFQEKLESSGYSYAILPVLYTRLIPTLFQFLISGNTNEFIEFIVKAESEYFSGQVLALQRNKEVLRDLIEGLSASVSIDKKMTRKSDVTFRQLLYSLFETPDDRVSQVLMDYIVNQSLLMSDGSENRP